MSCPGALELTEPERELLGKVRFDTRSVRTREEVLASGEAAVALMKALVTRHAIPDTRMRWFLDPELNLRTKKSRIQVFESNGTRGDDIFRHPHFLPYLRYFVYGPELPRPVVDGFWDRVSFLPFVSGSDMDELWGFAKHAVRSNGLDPHVAADEFQKLAIECDVPDSYARSIRDVVRRMR